jgi:hypothetical protein
MTSRKRSFLILLLVVVLLFFSGMVYLFVLRFESGDIYPPYSSYRSDPMGARAFYDGLGLLQGVTVLRNTEPLEKQQGMDDTVLFLVGLKEEGFHAMDASWIDAIEKTSREGGRVVIAFASDSTPASEGKALPPAEDVDKNADKRGKGQNEADGSGKGPPGRRGNAAPSGRWRISFGNLPERRGTARLVATEKGLPLFLDWRGAVVFEPQESGWRTIYAREGKPVVVERTTGKGEIVLLSESFLLSNEAIKGHRASPFLSWLCGRHKRILFDEAHLGVSAGPGIATLLKKEGLAPFFLSLIVLAVLAIWRQSAPFVPPPPEDEAGVAEAGRTHREGMANLLRRNIRPEDLLTVCLDEWEHSLARGPSSLASLTPSIRAIIAEEQSRPKKMRTPAQAYRRISALVTARRRGRK